LGSHEIREAECVTLSHSKTSQNWANTSLCECPFWPGAREAPKHFEKGGYSGACGTIKMRSKRRKRRRKRRKKGQK
jgi:hypothetical protein